MRLIKKNMSCEVTNSSTWGPTYWEFIHAYTIMYPNEPKREDKEHAAQLMKSIGEVIPCSSCKEHFKEKIKNVDYTSRDSLFSSLVSIHNSVNRKLGKTKYPLKLAKKKYSKYIKIGTYKYKNLFVFLGIIVTFFLLCTATFVYFKT